MKKLAFLGLLILLFTACPSGEPGQQLLEIAYGTTVEVPGEDMKLTFTNVNDSRCPRDVQCVIAGEAEAAFTVEKGGATETIVLKAKGLCYEEDGSCGTEATAMGYKFKLMSLLPYPEEGATPGQEEYTAKIDYSVFQTN